MTITNRIPPLPRFQGHFNWYITNDISMTDSLPTRSTLRLAKTASDVFIGWPFALMMKGLERYLQKKTSPNIHVTLTSGHYSYQGEVDYSDNLLINYQHGREVIDGRVIKRKSMNRRPWFLGKGSNWSLIRQAVKTAKAFAQKYDPQYLTKEAAASKTV